MAFSPYIAPPKDTRKRSGKVLGKRMKLAEAAFAALPQKAKCRESFLAITRAYGIKDEKAEDHFRLALSLIGGGS